MNSIRNYFNNKSPNQEVKLTSTDFANDVTFKIIDYDNKEIYDIVSSILTIADEHIKVTSSTDETLSDELQSKLSNANKLLKNMTGGRKHKRKTIKNKKVKKYKNLRI
jgi:transposase